MSRSVRFGRHELRPRERQLLQGGEAVPLGARAFDLLHALVERRDRVVGKRELLDIVWPDVVVEENNLQVQVSTLRKLIGASAIATVPGRGYRFTFPVDDDAERAPSVHPGSAPAASGVPGLVGRDEDLEALQALVCGQRLVTIVGAGGIGKTSLAKAVAARLHGRMRDGAWIVELAALPDPAMLPAVVAQTLGAALEGRRPPLDEIVEALAGRELLLVLDNCEHLVEAVGMLTSTLLARAPAVHLLATSQELLRVPQEHLFHVTPLALPREPGLEAARQSGAVCLFVERATALQPRFVLGEDNVGDVVEVCRRLDGLPLAIELAAARVPLLGVAGLRERLGERLRVLTAGSRTVLRRHQTLRELLDWSHGLLHDAERVVFRRAAAFSGSFALAPAQHALADDRLDQWAVLEHLGTLVDKSLLVVEPCEPPRYRMLESARAYALEKLREADETLQTLRRHAEAVTAQFEALRERIWLEPSQLRLERSLPDIDNLRAALDWAAEAGDDTLLIALTGASAWLWSAAGQEIEGLRRCRQALARVDSRTPPRLEARLQLARQALATPKFEGAEQAALARAIALYRELDDRPWLFVALGEQAGHCAMGGAFEAGRAALEEMERLADPAWPPALRWRLHKARVWMLGNQHRLDEAVAEHAPARRLAEEAGDELLLMHSIMWAEQTAQIQGRTREAVALGRQLVALTRRSPFSRLRGVSISNLATALLELGEVDEALPLVREAAVLTAAAGTLWIEFDVMALLALRRRRYEDAARLLGRADAAHAWRGGLRELGEQRLPGMVLAGLRDHLDAARIEALRAEGAAMTDEQAARLGLSS